MSYILDALKKAEHDRNLGDAPKLSFAPLSETQSHRSQILWVVVAALGVTVGVLAAMQISQMRSKPVTPVAKSVQEPVQDQAPAKPAARPKVVVVAPEPAVVVEPEAPKSKPVQVHTPQGPVEVEMPLTSRSKPAPAAANPEPAPQPVKAESEPQVTEPAEVPVNTEARLEPPPAQPLRVPTPAEAAAVYEGGQENEVPEFTSEPAPEPVAEENIVTYYGLPASTRNSLGELAMNAHVYSSTPGRGFVMINGSRYREGDRLDEGPDLDEIRPEGAVLNYRGQRFLLPVPR